MPKSFSNLYIYTYLSAKLLSGWTSGIQSFISEWSFRRSYPVKYKYNTYATRSNYDTIYGKANAIWRQATGSSL